MHGKLNHAAPPQLVIGITGHRTNNPTLVANAAAVEASLATLFERITVVAAEASEGAAPPPRLLSPLADGVDQMAARVALERGWQLVAPLPFGREMNSAVIAEPETAEDAARLAAGEEPLDPTVRRRAAAIRELSDKAHVVELSDRDRLVAERHGAFLAARHDRVLAQRFDGDVAEQVALASRMVIEHSDLVVAVWDGVVRNLPGGTGHTVAHALTLGTPVLLIDPAKPASWRLLLGPEHLAHHVAGAADEGSEALDLLITEAVRRPAAGSDATAGGDIVEAFARADVEATRLAAYYRRGMIANFVLAAASVIVGVAYLPLGISGEKWVSSAIELALLVSILAITAIAARRRWHARWLETRRFAEYLRHAPLMLMLGIMRPSARWPRGKGSRWPELLARDMMRSQGHPEEPIVEDYLRRVLEEHVRPHIRGQRDYHLGKVERLQRAHDRIERAAHVLFVLAAILVALDLILYALAGMGVVPRGWPHAAAPYATFLSVALPMTGATVSAIGHFSDFDRFGSISEIAASRLDALDRRTEALLALPGGALTYADAAALVRDLDEAVIDEIAGWQAVFEGKQITLPG